MEILRDDQVTGHHSQVAKLFQDHFGADKDLVGIEIGTACADLTVTLLHYVPNIKSLFTIDPWIHVDGVEFEASFAQEKHDTIRSHAYSRLADHSQRVTIMHMGSNEAAPIIRDQLYAKNIGCVDFVWIDGDHTLAQVRRDLENYWPFVKQGSIFGGHDFGQVVGLDGVVREFFAEKFPGVDVVKTGVDFTWWVLV